MNSNCTGCTKRDRIIKAQRQEIRRLRRIIEKAMQTCLEIGRAARDKMQEGNLPRAVWAYEKRAYLVAKTIATILRSH